MMRDFARLFFCMMALSSFAFASAGVAQENQVSQELIDIIDKYNRDIMIPSTKSACARQASYFHALTKKYEEGVTVSSLSGMKIMEPFVTNAYDDIESQGVLQARINNIERYRACAKDAKPEPTEKWEVANTKLYNACEGVHEIVIGTLQAIQEGKPLSFALKKYNNPKLDVEGMMIERAPKPAEFMITHMYGQAEEEAFSRAVDFGTAMSIRCISRMR